MNATLENSTFFVTCYILTNKAMLFKNFSSGTDKVVHVVTLVWCICLFLSTVFLITVTVGTIWTFRSLSQKVCYFTIMMQSVVDLAIGVIIYPMFIAHLTSEIWGSPNCDATYAMLVLSVCFTSIRWLRYQCWTSKDIWAFGIHCSTEQK
jgi:hypothetical protein